MKNNKEMNGYYNLITDMAKKLGDLKGYDVGYNTPLSGMMIISHQGHNYLIVAKMLSDDKTISEELYNNSYRSAKRLERLSED